MAALPVVFLTLVLQALWGSSSSSQLGPQSLAASDTVNDEYCHSCVKIDNFCYNLTYLFDLNAPFDLHHKVEKMGIMKSTNVLYYTFRPMSNDPEYSKVAYVSLNSSRNAGVITGRQVFNFETFDIHQDQNLVYLGGSDGIWVIHYSNLVPTLLVEKGNLITNIVLKYYVYYTKINTPGIIKCVKGSYQNMLQNMTIRNFVVDKLDRSNVVYLTDAGLFVLFNDQSVTVKLHNDPHFRGLTVDTNETVYAWRVDGIHKVELGGYFSQTQLKRVSGLVPDAMAFDKDNNIIYSIGKNLFKLTKVRTSSCGAV